MPVTYATHELVSKAWVKAAQNSTAVAMMLPQDSDTWYSTGFTQLSITGSSSNDYYALRSCVITAHCWAASQNKNSQNAPWGQAEQLAEAIAQGTWNESVAKVNNLSLGVTGAPTVHVLEAKIVEDPMRVPADEKHLAHFTVSIQLWWVQR